MVRTWWDKQEEQRRRHPDVLAQALAYSEARAAERREAADRQRAETQAAIDKAIRPTVSQAAPKTEADRLAANRRAVDLHRRADAVRQRTPRGGEAKLETARLTADQAQARREAEALLRTLALLGRPTATQAGATTSRTAGERTPMEPKTLSGAAYIALKAGEGATQTLAGAEDAARVTAAKAWDRIIRRAAESAPPEAATGAQDGGILSLAMRAARQTAEKAKGKARSVAETLALATEDPLAALTRAASGAVQRGADLAMAPVEQVGAGALRLQELLGGPGADELDREELTRRIMDGGVIREITGLDAKSAVLEEQRGKQSKAVRGAGDVASAIGALTPAVALTLATGQGHIALGAISASAGGDKSRTVWEATGDLDKAFRAGAATAVKEAATEALFGMVGGYLGKGVLDKATRRIIGERGVARWLAGALEEGAEEVLSTWLESYVDRATWDDQAQRATFRELLTAGALGSAVSLILGVPVAFSGGKMTVSDSDKLSEAQTRQVAEAAEKARAETQGEAEAETQAEGRPEEQARAEDLRLETLAAEEAPPETVTTPPPTSGQTATAGPETGSATRKPRQGRSLLAEATRRSREVRALADLSTAARRMMAASETLETARATGDAQQTAVAEQRYAEAESAFQAAKASVQQVQAEAAAARAAEPRAAGPPRTDTDVLSAALGRSEGLEPGGGTSRRLQELPGEIERARQEIGQTRAALTTARAMGDTAQVRMLSDRLAVAAEDANRLQAELAALKEDEAQAASLSDGEAPPPLPEPIREELRQAYREEGVPEEAIDGPVDPKAADPTTLSAVKEMMADVEAGVEAAADIRLDAKIARSLTGKGVGRMKDILRNLQNAAAGDRGTLEASLGMSKEVIGKDGWEKAGREQAAANYRELDEKIIRPFWEAKAAYQKAAREQLRRVKEIGKKYGIKKGSKESAAVQWIGEGQRQAGVSKEGKVQLEAYGEQDLKRDFGPERAKEIMAAAGEIRAIYDEYIGRLNAMLEGVYPDPEGKARADLAWLQGQIERARRQIHELETGAWQPELFGEGGDPATEAARLRQELAQATERYNEITQELRDGVYLEGKRLTPRRDYFHHFQEMSGGINALLRIIDGSQAIDPLLVGVSEETKPRSRFAGWMRHRGRGAYTEDAIGGLQAYIPAAEHKIAYDPFTARMRGIIRGLAEDTRKTRNANDLIQWLTDWTNDIAGKTNPLDRWLVQSGGGRKAMAILRWFNRRVRGNAVVGSARTFFAQAFNLGNSVKYISDPTDWIVGAKLAGKQRIAELFKKEIATPMDESAYIGERYLERDISALDAGLRGNVEKLAAWMLRRLDESATKMIWCSAYAKGERIGIPDGKLVQYADEITMKATGGRGVGETPLAMKSELTKMIAPFQLEINNAWQATKEVIRDKSSPAAKRMAVLLASTVVDHLMNAALREWLGFDVAYAPIQALLDAIREWRELPEEEWAEEGEKTRTAGRLAGMIATRQLGELMSNVPFGKQLAEAIIPEDADRKAIFGETDPTRFGTGNIGISMVTQPLITAAKGEDFSDDLLSLALNVGLPLGGKQTERVIGEVKRRTGFDPVLQIGGEGGTQIFATPERTPGTSYSKSGNVRYVQGDGLAEALLGGAFGEWSSRAGREYMEGGGKPLSAQASRDYERLAAAGVKQADALRLARDIESGKAKTGLRQLADRAKLTAPQRELAAEMTLGTISPERLEKAQTAKEHGISYLDALEYGAAAGDSAKDARAWLEKSGLRASQKEWLYNHPMEGQERDGSYSQWEAAKAELADNERFRRLSPADREALLGKCMSYAPGDSAKADAAVAAGWSLAEYYLWSVYAGRLHADKDASGKAISGSAKDKKLRMMELSGLPRGKQALFLMLSEGLKLDKEMMDAANAELARQGLSREELEEIAEVCGCKLSDGKLVR